MHHNKQNMTINMKNNQGGDDVNLRCCKQTNSPHNEIVHMFIYIPTCARIMSFANGANQINIHNLMKAKRIYIYIYLPFPLIHT